MARCTKHPLVFTDLDGTLLGHHDYGHGPALTALQRLAEAGIPCVINTSKTAREVLPLHQALGLSAPVIVENGSAIGFPPGNSPWQHESLAPPPHPEWQWLILGRPRQEMLPVLQRLRGRGYAFRGFSEMAPEQVVELTGLTPENAAAARCRHYSEPLHWQGEADQFQPFAEEAAAHGLQAVQGGRFVQITGAGVDKGRALNWCASCYRPGRPQTIALGDAPNDDAMLAAADIAVWVRSPVHGPGNARGRQQTLHTRLTGPAGWNQAIHQILDQNEAAHG